VHGTAESKFELKNRTVVYRSDLEMHSDLKNFYYAYRREVLENGRIVRQRTWQETIPRDHQ